MPFAGTNFRALLFLAMLSLAISSVVTILVATEVPLFQPTAHDSSIQETGKEDKPPRGCLFLCGSSVVNTVKGLNPATMKTTILRLYLLYFFSQASIQSWNYFFTTYMGEDVYHGDPKAPHDSKPYEEFQKGVQAGSLGMALSSLVTMLFSLILIPSAKCISYKLIYFFGLIVAALCMFLPAVPQLQTVSFQVTVAAILGIWISIIRAVPYTLIGLMTSPKDFGLYSGGLNSISVLAQLLSTYLGTFLMTKAAFLHLGKISTGIALGGIFAVLGCPFTFTLIIPLKPESDKGDPDEKRRLLQTASL